MIVETNPMNYGHYWRVALGKIYTAMCDVDSGSGRARGLLRISLESARALTLGISEEGDAASLLYHG